jgi:hypothetical protein
MVVECFIIDDMPRKKSLPHLESRTVLVSGIPASGKSTYAHWLEETKGFMHLDFDVLLRGEGPEHKLALVRALQPTVESLASFVEGLRRVRSLIVIDWGFPPNCLPMVSAFQHHGVALWWFDGDREAARRSFIRRGDVAITAFNWQMRSIEQRWSKIKAVIGKHMIRTVKPDGSYMPQEKIFQLMFRPTAV